MNPIDDLKKNDDNDSVLKKESNMGKAIEFTDSNFETEVLNSETPVLVDFWATWCGPCKMIAPVIEELAGEMEGKVKVGKVDVDQNRGLSIKFNVRSIPTLMIFHKGQAVETMVGVRPKSELESKLTQLA